LGNPGLFACGGIFKNNRGDFLGSFAINIGIADALRLSF
jgi:hypothetical protein